MPIINGQGRVGIRQRPPQYLLDAYSGAALAFSLRRLNSAYTGPAIRIRRESDNTEMDIDFADSSVTSVANTTSTNYMSGQLKDYVNESQIINFCGTNRGRIVRIYDQSGNGNHLNQTVAASQVLLYFNGGDGWGSSAFFNRKQNYGGLSGKMAFGVGGYTLTNGVSTDNNWTAFSIGAGTAIHTRLSNGTSNGFTLMTGYAFIDGGWRLGSKTKYAMSSGQYAAGGSDPLIMQLYGKPQLITTINSNNTLGLRINNNTINLPSVQSSTNTGIFDRLAGDNGMFELVLFNSDKSSITQDIENTMLSYYSTSWTAFKG